MSFKNWQTHIKHSMDKQKIKGDKANTLIYFACHSRYIKSLEWKFWYTLDCALLSQYYTIHSSIQLILEFIRLCPWRVQKLLPQNVSKFNYNFLSIIHNVSLFIMLFRKVLNFITREINTRIVVVFVQIAWRNFGRKFTKDVIKDLNMIQFG